MTTPREYFHLRIPKAFSDEMVDLLRFYLPNDIDQSAAFIIIDHAIDAAKWCPRYGGEDVRGQDFALLSAILNDRRFDAHYHEIARLAAAEKVTLPRPLVERVTDMEELGNFPGWDSSKNLRLVEGQWGCYVNGCNGEKFCTWEIAPRSDDEDVIKIRQCMTCGHRTRY